MKRPRYAERLRQNAADYYADRITHEEHGRRNGAIWREIEARPPHVKGSVLATLRKTLPPARVSA